MKMILILAAVACSFSHGAANAQIPNQKKEIVALKGDFDSCKQLIERAGSVKNLVAVEWEQHTQSATLIYNTERTNRDRILKRIALSGFDNELYYAPDEAYAALPKCCRYERDKAGENSGAEDVFMADHSKNGINSPQTHVVTKSFMAAESNDPLIPVFDAYFNVKDALVASDGQAASGNAASLFKALNNVKMESLDQDSHMAWMKVRTDLIEATEQMEMNKDVNAQRKIFMDISENMYVLMKASNLENPAYYQFCPMANEGQGANWLSLETEIRNPYYGTQMLNCGKTVETIN